MMDVHNARPCRGRLAAGGGRRRIRWNGLLTEPENALRYLAHLGGNAGVKRKEKRFRRVLTKAESGVRW